MKGQVHEEIIKNLKQRGDQTEADKEWSIPMPQPDGRNIPGQASVQRVVQEIFDTILRDLVWVVNRAAPAGHLAVGVAIDHTFQGT